MVTHRQMPAGGVRRRVGCRGRDTRHRRHRQVVTAGATPVRSQRERGPGAERALRTGAVGGGEHAAR